MSVYKDELLQPQTDNTPKFLGLTQRGGAWAKGGAGEDVVVGIIDTGINPEHPSFADTRTQVRGERGQTVRYRDVPSSRTGSDCEFGNSEYNINDAAFDCSNKLIKAQYFVDGFGVPACTNETYQGDISGIALRARITVYNIMLARRG